MLPIDAFVPAIRSFRGLLLIAILVIAAGLYLAVSNSKEWTGYKKISGNIDYLDQQYGAWPNRDHGAYRYLKIDTWPEVFEIYGPNGRPTDKVLDDLKMGEWIDIYFNAQLPNSGDGLNRHVQGVAKADVPYFIAGDFQKKLGILLAGLGACVIVMGWFFWSRKKLSW